MLGQARSTQRYAPRRSSKDASLAKRLHELSRAQPRFGYRRITALLQQEGWQVNRKRIQRLWRAEGLKVPSKTRKRRRLGSSENGCVRHRASRPHQVWAVDFVMDQTEDGRRLKLLTVTDEFTRYNLSIEVARRMRAKDVSRELERLMTLYGAPEHVRSDNGPEFIAQALRKTLRESGSETLFIEPGSPWENGYAESFNGKLRDECLNLELLASLKEAQIVIENWRRTYNQTRPHSALDYQTPAAFLVQENARLGQEVLS